MKLSTSFRVVKYVWIYMPGDRRDKTLCKSALCSPPTSDGCRQPSEVGGEQRALLQSVLSRRSPGIYIQTYFTTRNEVESFIETGCRKHYSNRLYNDRNPLSMGGNFFERSRLQRSGPDSAFYARYNHPERCVATGLCRRTH